MNAKGPGTTIRCSAQAEQSSYRQHHSPLRADQSPVFPCRSARPCPSSTDMAERKISDVLAKPDAALEMTLRPSLFSEILLEPMWGLGLNEPP